jgi:hypothetical protein
VEATLARQTRVILAAAHLDHNPGNNRRRNLRSLCQRCHMIPIDRTTWHSAGLPICCGVPSAICSSVPIAGARRALRKNKKAFLAGDHR